MVEHIIVGQSTLVFYRNVNHRYEVSAVTRVTLPNAVGIHSVRCFLLFGRRVRFTFVLRVHFLLQLLAQVFVAIFLLLISIEGCLRHIFIALLAHYVLFHWLFWFCLWFILSFCHALFLLFFYGSFSGCYGFKLSFRLTSSVLGYRSQKLFRRHGAILFGLCLFIFFIFEERRLIVIISHRPFVF